MMDGVLLALTILAALGSGLVAGLFFAFSTFVMTALSRLTPANGIAAMQSINVVVLNPWFLGLFFGTGAVCVLLILAALWTWRAPGSAWLLLGGLIYLAGEILVTIRCNVPLNNALAVVQPDSAEGADLWRRYLSRWTAWNHVRTAAGLAAAALLTIAACYQARVLDAA